MSDFIPLSEPVIRGNEWKYVKECLDTGWVSSGGAYVKRFEDDIAAYVGTAHAIACVNGTAALHVALQVAGVREGDEVIVPTLTFIAPVNAVRYLQAEPVFMDCDQYYTIDAEKTVDFIRTKTTFRRGYSYNRQTGKRISAIIPVHVYGNAVAFDDLIPLCKERNIKVIEDATESLGTVYTKGRYAGKHTGTVGDIGCISFNGNKIITTGGGGMIVTKKSAFAYKARYLTTQAKDDELYYIHNEVGYNFRLTNIQAAVGVAQLEQLPRYLEIKERHYSAYKKKVDRIAGLKIAETPAFASANKWMYLMQIEAAEYGKDRDHVMNFLQKVNIQSRPVWHLNHLQRPYKHCQKFLISTATRLVQCSLSLPCSVSLRIKDIERVVRSLNHD